MPRPPAFPSGWCSGSSWGGFLWGGSGGRGGGGGPSGGGRAGARDRPGWHVSGRARRRGGGLARRPEGVGLLWMALALAVTAGEDPRSRLQSLEQRHAAEASRAAGLMARESSAERSLAESE